MNSLLRGQEWTLWVGIMHFAPFERARGDIRTKGGIWKDKFQFFNIAWIC